MSATAQQRLDSLASWHDDWSGLTVGVYGLGEIGFSIADTLTELGSDVRVIHTASDPERVRLLEVIGAEHREVSRDAVLEAFQLFNPDLVVVTPVTPLDDPVVEWARARDAHVWSDADLAWRLRDKTPRVADWICVAGSHGAPGIAELTAHMLYEGDLRVAPVGRGGMPVLDAIRDPQGYDALVLDLSSEQLHWIDHMSPFASVCFTFDASASGAHEDPLEHRRALAKVYENTRIACVYNRADASTELMVEEADVVEGARAISFGLDTPPPSGLGMVEGLLIDRGFHPERRREALELLSLEELAEYSVNTPHTVQQILAAAALARARGVSPEQIAAAVHRFYRQD